MALSNNPHRRAQRKPSKARHMTGLIKTALLLFLGAVAVTMLVLFMRPSAQYRNSPEVQRARRLGVLRVGVRTDVPGFSQNEQGLEIELAQALAARIFPDLDPSAVLELVPVTAYTALPKINSGDIDIAFAMQTNPNSDSYTTSGVYYNDPVCMLCLPANQQAALSAQKVGIIQASPVEKVWTAYNQEREAELSSGPYVSYPDMREALLAGKVDFAAIPRSRAGDYLGGGVVLHPETLGNIGYVAVSSSESPSFALIADMMIQSMQQDGALAALIDRYALAKTPTAPVNPPASPPPSPAEDLPASPAA